MTHRDPKPANTRHYGRRTGYRLAREDAAHRSLMRWLSQATPDEVFQSSVRAGVHRPDGSLTAPYASDDYEDAGGAQDASTRQPGGLAEALVNWVETRRTETPAEREARLDEAARVCNAAAHAAYLSEAARRAVYDQGSNATSDAIAASIAKAVGGTAKGNVVTWPAFTSGAVQPSAASRVTVLVGHTLDRPTPHCPTCSACATTHRWSQVNALPRERRTGPYRSTIMVPTCCGIALTQEQTVATCACKRSWTLAEWAHVDTWVVDCGGWREEWAVCACQRTVRVDGGEK